MDNFDKNDQVFLKEIQKKINKRSKGLYYNSRVSQTKRNLTIVTIVVLIITTIIISANVFFSKSVKIDKIKGKRGEKVEKNVRKFRKLEITYKNYQYIIKFKNLKNSKNYVFKILNRYKSYNKDGFINYKIPQKEIKNVLKYFKKVEIEVKKDRFLSKKDHSLISIDKNDFE